MEDGSEIRLTIARYHTPSGRVIQSPYENGKADEYYKDFYDRYLRGESFSRDSIHFPDSLKFKTLRLGRTVYGGVCLCLRTPQHIRPTMPLCSVRDWS